MPKAHETKPLFVALALTALLSLTPTAPAQRTDDPLAQGFKQPVDSAKPRTWWHDTVSDWDQFLKSLQKHLRP